MKKILYICLVMSAAVACGGFDDSAIWDELKDHERRIAQLEQICARMNSDIAAQQSIMAALQEYDYVTGVTDIIENGQVVGYTISFHKGESIDIYHGQNGTDCNTPQIGLGKSTDGSYYWTIDGKVVSYTPETVTPQLKIEDGIWYVSYDEGQTWIELYFSDADGNPDGGSFFQSIDTSDPNSILITFTNGEQVKLPTWKAFQDLQTLVNQLNTNISSLQSIVSALQDYDHVVDVQPVITDGVVTGHTIYFAKALPVTIYHGKDGADASVPVIGVKKDTDETYYWTIDGEWMDDVDDIPHDQDSYWVIDGEWLGDANGNRVPAAGAGGKDGATPQLKILDGYWYVSFDGGRTWSTEPLGPATMEIDASIFSDITYDEDYLSLVLKNGETIQVPRHPFEEVVEFTSELVKTTHHSATFVGHVGVAEDELPYCRATVYFSDAEGFNIHTAQTLSTQTFDYNGNFTLTVDGLESDHRYTYCLAVETKTGEAYGQVMEFVTDKRVAAVLDLSAYETVQGCVSTNYGTTQWANTSTTYFHYQIPLADLGYPSWITITANTSYKSYIAFFKEKATSVHNGKLPPYAAGYESQVVMNAGTTQTFDIPFNAEYIYILSVNTNGNIDPSLIEYEKP